MTNFSAKIDLLKLRGAMVAPLKFGEKEEQCLIIPIAGSALFEGKQGLYLDMTAVEMREQRFGDSHFVKQSLPRDEYLAMSKEERDAQPILGSLRSIEQRSQQPAAQERENRGTYSRPAPATRPDDF